MKKYLSILCMLLLSIPTLVSCSNDDDLNFASDEEMSLMEVQGKLGKEEACKLVFPDKAIIKNPFDSKWSSFYVEEGQNAVFAATSMVKKPRDIEHLSLSAAFKNLDISTLKAGDKLIPSSGSLSKWISSNLNDHMRLKENSGAIYVRYIDGSSITLYLDHLKFDCAGGYYLTQGEYLIYGDLKLSIEKK